MEMYNVTKIKDRLRNWVRSGNYIPVARDLVMESVKENAVVFEIGPGEAEILTEVAGRFPEAKLVALDHHEKVLSNVPDGTRCIRMDLWELLDHDKELVHFPVSSGKVDVLILTEVIEHVVFPQLLVAEIARVLKPAGYLIISTPNIHCLGNRLAVLFGVDKIFPRVGAEGFIANISFHSFGHVAHYSFKSLQSLMSPWFDVVKTKGAGFKVPGLRFIQPWMIRCFPTLSNNMVFLCSKRAIENTDLIVADCPLVSASQLILPDGRCLHPQAHSKTCQRCEFFHKDFLHRRDSKKSPNYSPEGF
jgi:ubiquinone/menaquinone biosynthesis C-methylase UbiE